MNVLTDNIAAWLGATLLALLTVFSDRIVGRIRFRLNRADLRVKYFEELAVALSTYLFYAAIFEERFRREWTKDRADIEAVADEVNAAITTLRTKEYVYRAWSRKYWGPSAADGLASLFVKLTALDDAIHAFNDKGGQVEKVRNLGTLLEEAKLGVESWLSENDA